MRKTKRRIVSKIIKKRRENAEKEQELIRLADEAQLKAIVAETKLLESLGVEKKTEVIKTEDGKEEIVEVVVKKGRPKKVEVKEEVKEGKVDEQA